MYSVSPYQAFTVYLVPVVVHVHIIHSAVVTIRVQCKDRMSHFHFSDIVRFSIKIPKVNKLAIVSS